MKYKGTAYIELEDENGKKEIIEHNNLSNFLNNMFKDGQLDSYCSPNKSLKNYFNRIVLLDGVPKSSVIDDNINIIKVMNATSTATDANGNITLTFEFPLNDEYSNIECIALAPSSFIDFTTELQSSISGLLNTQRGFATNVNYKGVFKIDFENNIVWAYNYTNLSNMSPNSDWYVTIKKYYHDFKAIPFTNKDVWNMKLIESTNINLKSIITSSGVSSTKFMNWAYDDYTNQLFFIYFNNNNKTFNVCVTDFENTEETHMYNMTLPNELTPKMQYGSSDPFSEMATYKGRLLLYATITDENGTRTGYFGINPKNTTDYIEYETIYVENGLSNITFDDCLHGMPTDTTWASHVYLKNNKAYVCGSTNSRPAGSYYKSKDVFVTTSTDFYDNVYPYIRFRINPVEISTINEMTKTLYKTAGKSMKIVYKLEQEAY